MGNGASTSFSKETDDHSRYRRAVIDKKARAVGNFNKYVSHRELTKLSREELKDFLKIQRQERQNLEDDLDKEETSVDRFQIRPKTAGVRRSTLESKGPDWRKVEVKIESDAACFICEEVINFLISGYPCRVCTRIFHKDCLESFEGCRAGDLAMAERAHSLTGWSCFRCGDLTNLLTDDELRLMIEEFDCLDLNRDAFISFEEYMKYKGLVHQRQEETAMSQSDWRKHKMIFQMMDADGSGAIDWWEFVNHECTRILAKRNRENLAQLLSDKETQRLKEQFGAMDDNEDGVITEFEARKAYRGWFASFGAGEWKSSAVFGESLELEAHVAEGSRFFANADADHSGLVTWEEYKNERALYVLSNRPNLRFPTEFVGS